MNKATQYRLLDTMGINLWLSRRDPAPLLQSNAPLFGAACLVLLPQKLPKDAVEQRKVLSGMLKVLCLDSEEICVAWLQDPSQLQEPQNISAAILHWAPHSLLVLGDFLANCLELVDLEKIFHIVTYHPRDLIEHPEKKRTAHQDLLTLKEELQKMRFA